jgi:cell division protein FtsB
MFFFFDCELIFMINLVIGKGSAEAQEKLLRSQALHETECEQQPQEMMATNSNFT